MEHARVLREQQRLLAAEYGVGEPRPVEGEDLESDGIAEVLHWVEVYSELAEYTRSRLESASAAATEVPDRAPTDLRMLMLQAQIQELHLTYWVNRLNRLRGQSASDRRRPD